MHGAHSQEGGLRAGTENVAFCVAMGAACALAAAGANAEAARLYDLRAELLSRLRAAHPDAVVHGPLGAAAAELPVSAARASTSSDGGTTTTGAERTGLASALPNTLSIAFPGAVAGHVVKQLADAVACSAGAACHSADVSQATTQRVSHVLEAMGVPRHLAVCTLRLSLGRWSTADDVHAAAAMIADAVTAARSAAAAPAVAAASGSDAKALPPPAAWASERLYLDDATRLQNTGARVLAVAVRVGAEWRSVRADGSVCDAAGGSVADGCPPAAAWGPVPGGTTNSLTVAVMLSATVAHPQGGGQPADTGVLAVPAPDGAGLQPVFAFTAVRRGGAGADEAIVHMGKLGVVGHGTAAGSERLAAETSVDERALQQLADSVTEGPSAASAGGGKPATAPGGAADADLDVARIARDAALALLQPPGSAQVTVAVNGPRRALAARLHSGGHLLDLAVKHALAGTAHASSLSPGKGYHFFDSPYVEYETVPGAPPLPAELIARLPAALTAACAQLAAADATTGSVLLPAGSAELAAALAPSGASVAHLSPGAPVRVVTVGGADNACPCGGTHVASARVLSGLVVTSVKLKKGVLRVSYSLPQPERASR
jgi:Ser-tRNA(Ala) deacylase AlaX